MYPARRYSQNEPENMFLDKNWRRYGCFKLLSQIFSQAYLKVEAMYPAGRSSQNDPENMFFGQELKEIRLF